MRRRPSCACRSLAIAADRTSCAGSWRCWSAIVMIFLFVPIALVVLHSFNRGGSFSIWSGHTSTKWWGALFRPDKTWPVVLSIVACHGAGRGDPDHRQACDGPSSNRFVRRGPDLSPSSSRSSLPDSRRTGSATSSVTRTRGRAPELVHRCDRGHGHRCGARRPGRRGPRPSPRRMDQAVHVRGVPDPRDARDHGRDRPRRMDAAARGAVQRTRSDS